MTGVQERLDRILKTLSKKLQIDLGYFVKGGFWLSLPFIANNLLGLLRSVFLAGLVEQQVYGRFTFITSVTAATEPLTLPGINPALTESVARGNTGALHDASKTRLRWSLLSSLALLVAAVIFYLRGESDLFPGLVAASAFLPLMSAFQVVVAYYNGKKRFDRVSLISISFSILNTALILGVLWLKLGLVWLVIANFGSSALLYFIFYWQAAREAAGGPRDPQMVPYGRTLTWAGAISSFAFELDAVVLGIFAGFLDLAIYSVASIIPEALKALMKAFTPLVLPKIAEKPDKQVYTHHTRRQLLLLFIINIVVVAAAIVVIPFAIRLLYPRYLESIPIAQLLLLSLLPSLLTYFFNAALQARKQTRAIYHYNLIYGLLQVGTLLVFTPLWGLTGVVLSRIVTRWGSTLYQWYAVSKI